MGPITFSIGAGQRDYSLVVTRNADLDTESNDSIATAQPIAGHRGRRITVVPRVRRAVKCSSLYTTGNDGLQLITIDTATGAGTCRPVWHLLDVHGGIHAGTAPWTIIYGFDPSLAQLAKVDLVSGGSPR